MAKLWPLIAQWPTRSPVELVIYVATDNGTYSALADGMPAQQHVASAHKDGGHRTSGLVREPDGVPHDVVGLSALFSFLFAAVVLGMWLSGSTGRIAAVAICMVGVPMLVSGLRQRSARERGER